MKITKTVFSEHVKSLITLKEMHPKNIAPRTTKRKGRRYLECDLGELGTLFIIIRDEEMQKITRAKNLALNPFKVAYFPKQNNNYQETRK